MKTYGVFDIIGPQMIGPSSSHTAGAARLGLIAYHMAGGDVSRADVSLYGSFADTGKGHGTDKAIVGGLLGFGPGDERLRDSFKLAEEAGIDITFHMSDELTAHPNTARIKVYDHKGGCVDMLGASVGGGNIEVEEVDGMEVEFSCDYPTLLIFYPDIPGMIQKVTSVLAEHSINIAFMRVFRTSKSKEASMVIETDERVPQALIEEIKKRAPEIERVSEI